MCYIDKIPSGIVTEWSCYKQVNQGIVSFSDVPSSFVSASLTVIVCSLDKELPAVYWYVCADIILPPSSFNLCHRTPLNFTSL